MERVQLSDRMKFGVRHAPPVHRGDTRIGIHGVAGGSRSGRRRWACKPLMGVDPVAWIDITEDSYVLRAKTGSGDGRIAFEADLSSFANFDVLSGPLLDLGASTGNLASHDPPRLMLRGDTGIFFMCEPAKP